MKLSFSFSGWMRGASIESVYDTQTGEDVLVSDILASLGGNRGPQSLMEGLNSGKYVISMIFLGDVLNTGEYGKVEAEFSDFELLDDNFEKVV